MVLCIIAMVVFGILGIFSVGYRKLAKESFKCVFRMATLRPCESNFDEKIKTHLLSKLISFPKIARFTNTHFSFLSWIFVILFFVSLAYSGYAVYNLVAFGTCDPQHPENCIFTPLVYSTDTPNKDACEIENNFIEFYGATCPHCKNMESVVNVTESDKNVRFEKLEVFFNESNNKKFFSFEKGIKDSCGFMGVPTFYSQKTDKAICGEITQEKLEEFIISNG